MTTPGPYEALLAHIRNWIFGMPDHDRLMELLRLRFSPEEAAFLAGFPHKPHTIEQLAQRFGVSPEVLSGAMGPLIAKGLICEIEGARAVRYSFTDPIFFLYRMPGWKGESDEWNRRTAVVSNIYYADAMAADFRGYLTKGLRTIPINAVIRDTRQVLPYENAAQLLDREKLITVTSCACRHRKNLDPGTASCTHNVKNCLHFGKLAHYIVKYDLGERIPRERAFEILEESAAAGLVHGVSNSKKGMDTICNCCSCCCVFFESVKAPPLVPKGHQPSNYILEVDERDCVACGLCVERCPMSALSLKEDIVQLDADLCLGCGVCAHTCLTQSLSLKRRKTEQDYPESLNETGYRFLTERRIDPAQVF